MLAVRGGGGRCAAPFWGDVWFFAVHGDDTRQLWNTNATRDLLLLYGERKSMGGVVHHYTHDHSIRDTVHALSKDNPGVMTPKIVEMLARFIDRREQVRLPIGF